MPTQTIEVLRIPGTLFPRGPFDENADYKFLNFVESGGNGYVCLQPCTGIPVTNTAYWFKFVFKGDKGDAFTYADLTAEQKAELVRDATAAAQAAASSAQSAADDAAAALQKFNTIKAAIDAIDPQSTEGSIQTLAAKQGLLEADLNALGPKIGDRSFDVNSATKGSYYALGSAVTIDSVYTGATTSSSGYSRYPIITLLKGESISIAVLGGNGARAYCITDADTDKVLAKAAANLDLRQSPSSYTAEKSVKIYINDLSPYNGKVVVSGNIANRFSDMQPAVENISAKLADTETSLSETSVLSGYVIATDATLYQVSSSSYKVHFFTITGGQYLKLSLRRSANAAATRLSVSFFSTQDDTGYTLVASNQITSQMRWVQNGGKALDFTIQSPVGANRIAVYGGDIESNVTSISVIALALTDLNELALAKSRIMNSMMKVESYPNNELSSRITNIEGQIYEVTQFGASNLRSGYYYSYADLDIGDVFDGSPKSFSGTGWYILSPLRLKKGSAVEVSTNGGTNGRAVCITDTSGVILFLSPENADYRTNHFTYTATQDVVVYVNLTGATTSFSVVTKESVIDGGGSSSGKSPRIVNPRIDIRNASQIKVLEIGNSFSTDATDYLDDFIAASGISLTDFCIYKIVRGSGSFKTFIDSWNNADSYSGSTGCFYTLSKVIGGLTPSISGSTNYEKMHSAFSDVKWDIIMIHQVSDYADDVNAWEGRGNGGYIQEFFRILKTYQPQAMIGHLWAHASRLNSEGGDTAALWAETKKGVVFLQNNFGIDFVVPVATAIENIRSSSINTSSHGLSRDGHHLGYGLARYVAAATYFQTMVCGRYGGSVVGNTCVHTVTTSEHNDVGESYQGDLIDVTAENRQVAQIAAALACSDMFTIVNPDDVGI